MKISLTTGSIKSVQADVLAFGLHGGKLASDPTAKVIDKLVKGALVRVAKDDDFTGKKGESLRVQVNSGLNARRIVVVGLGKGSSNAADLRQLGAKVAELSGRYRSVAVVASSSDPSEVRALAEGLLVGAYRYTEYFTGDRLPKRQLRTATLVLPSKVEASHREALQEATVVAQAISLVRDLVNCPPNDMTPRALAECAAREAASSGIKCTVFDKKRIEKEGMNLLMAVNRGSGEEPRFVHMAYRPERSAGAVRKVVFVGKGLTFDSGGLCLKPSKSMLDMKCDMAGGALTIGIVLAAARLKLGVEVHGIIPSTENMTGENAYRPGDVYKSLDGKTVEIINTDAEGRLILADALAYARKLEPDVLIDHATLTGACMVALGQSTAGLFTPDDELASQYRQAAERAGESFWRLPLTEDMRESLKSDIADLKHTGESFGGAITAALFLKEFVGDSKWMHLDIAGPAFGERPRGIYGKGGTAFGLLTAIEFLRKLADG